VNNRGKKFYNKNEKRKLSALGFIPTLASGSGWIDKEDGESEYALAQHKTTDADSIRIHLKDLLTLKYNADLCRKLGVFFFEFLQADKTFLCVDVDDIDMLKDIILGKPIQTTEVIIEHSGKSYFDDKPVVKSAAKERERFFEEEEQKWRK
jgi:hypothetical protein